MITVKATNDVAAKVLSSLVELSPVLFQELKEPAPTPLPKPAPKPEPKPDPSVMPKIDITEHDSPNQSERTQPISKLLIHNTDGPTLDGAVSWLCNTESQASAHLIIGRDGKVACIVDFDKAAWHAGNRYVNHASIGIECVADKNNLGLTPVQERVLVEWVKWFQWKYGIKTEDIITHRTIVATSCPVHIWSTEAKFLAWRKASFGV
jgi:N-acetyl-anhydromuramyl-L-alanine amidase AmpD